MRLDIPMVILLGELNRSESMELLGELGSEIGRYLFTFVMIVFVYSAYSSYFKYPKMHHNHLWKNIVIWTIFVGGFGVIALNSSYIESEKNVLLRVMAICFFYFLVAVMCLKTKYVAKLRHVFATIILLQVVGIVMLTRLDLELANQQSFWLLISFGVFIMVTAIFTKHEFYQRMTYLYGAMALGFLSLPFFFGLQLNGATNWVKIYNIGFQPSEFVKILYILFMAGLYKKKRSFKDLFIGTFFSGIVILLLIYEKDLGGALIFTILYGFLTYHYLRHEIFLIAYFASIGGIGYLGYRLLGESTFFHYAKLRFNGWLDPWENFSTTGYQVAQSLFGIVEGGWLGTGLGRCSPRLIPYVSTDFIFAGICEELGVLVGIGLVALYGMLFFQIIKDCKSQPTFYKNILLGFGILLAFQVFVIIGGVIQLIPVTGVTLPFLSYGGSSLLSYTIIFAVYRAIVVKDVRHEEKTTNEEKIKENK